MKKKLYCSLLCVMVSAAGLGIVVGTAQGITNSIFNFNHTSLRRNTFVIDDETQYQSQGTYYTAVALSEQNSLLTMFSGFELENDKLVLPAGEIGVIANIDPMNVGFNRLKVDLTGNTNNFKYSVISAFSYFDISDKAIEIATGSYADLQTFAHVHVASSGAVVEDITTTQLPGMSDCRHTLTVIIADATLTLNEVIFGTECVAQVPTKTDIGTFSNYRASELAIIESNFGGYLPFVGSGLYYFYQDGTDLYFEGAFGDMSLAIPVISDFGENNYIPTVEVEPNPYGQIIMQTIANNVVYTADISYCANALFTYKIRLNNTEELYGVLDEWPVDLFAERLSTEFCDILEENQLPDQGEKFYEITELVYDEETLESRRGLGLVIYGYEPAGGLTSDQVAFLALVDYLRSLVNDPDLGFIITEDATPYEAQFIAGEEYSFSISDGIHSMTAIYSDPIVALLFLEPRLVTGFPLQLINEVLALPQGKSVPNYLGIGQFSYSNREGQTSLNVEIYYSNKASVNLYRNALLDSGLKIYSEGIGYVEFRSDVFDAYCVQIHYYDVDTLNKFSIYFRRNDDFRRVNSLSDALSAYTTEQLILDHVYPTISGDHLYRVVTDNYSYNEYRTTKGIYISDLDQAYVNDLVNGATYNAYYNAYVFESETEGTNVFAIRVETLPNGVRIEPMSLYLDPNHELLDSTAANALLQATFNDKYGDLATGTAEEQALYAQLVDAFIYAPDSNGAKVYSVVDGQLEFFVYGKDRLAYIAAYDQAAGNHSYEYSKLQNRYYYGNTTIEVIRNDSVEDDYDSSRTKFSFHDNNTTYHYAEFVSHDNAGLSDIELDFIVFPHQGDEEMFYRAPGSDQVIVSDEFDQRQYINDLLNAGFYYYQNGYPEYQLRKSVGTTLYKITSNTYMYEAGHYAIYSVDPRGFRGYKFEVIENYYEDFNSAITNYEYELNATLVAALPSYSGDASFHIEAGYMDSFDINYALSVDMDAFIAALRAKGYVNTDSHNTNFVYAGEDFSVTVYIDSSMDNHRISFYLHDYTWRVFPTAAQAADTCYYLLSDYIPRPDETGAIYASPDNYGCENFVFTLKSTVDLDAYLAKLEVSGFEVRKYKDGTGGSYEFDNGTININGSYYNEPMGYHFYFYCNNYSELTKRINVLDLNTYYSYRWNFNPNFVSEDYYIDATYLSHGYSSDYRDVNFIIYTDSQSLSDFEAYIVASGEYQTIQYMEHYYYKDVDGVRYSININGEYIYFAAQIRN